MKIPSNSSVRKLILGILILVLLAWIVKQPSVKGDVGKIPLYDFIEYWSAARTFLSGGDPYNAQQLLETQRSAGWTDSKPIMMWNPPWTLPLLIPFAVLPFWVARSLWSLLGLSLVLMSVDWFWRQYGGPVSRRRVSWFASLLFIPFGTSLFLGQISPMILAALTGFLWALSENRPALAGVFTLPIAAKPHLLYLFWLFLLLWIIKERQWRVLLGAIAALLASSLLVFLIHPATFHHYVSSITSSSGPQIWQTPTWGVAILMLFPKAAAWVRFIPSLLGIGIACWLWKSWHRTFDWLRHLPTMMLLSVTSSSFTWMFDWVILLPIIALLLAWYLLQPLRRWWLLAALAIMQPLLVFSPGVSHTNFYTIWLPPALWLLYWARQRTEDRARQFDPA